MASSMMLIFRLNRFPALCRNIPQCSQNYRAISTSNKSKDTSVAVDPIVKPKVSEEKILQKKDWVSYGYDYTNETQDRIAAHLTWFGGLSLALIGGSFLVRYMPDYRMKDWAVREAFLEIHRRETNGLPLIDEDLIPRDKIILPTEEELVDTEVII
uniref:NADH dehydrogenase [ubiquinone] 1 beta subcomplex subunit 11, mitochondrial n=1 Tax=Strigamia maritima TaxID=126957 RepID=T1JFL1_STRMM